MTVSINSLNTNLIHSCAYNEIEEYHKLHRYSICAFFLFHLTSWILTTVTCANWWLFFTALVLNRCFYAGFCYVFCYLIHGRYHLFSLEMPVIYLGYHDFNLLMQSCCFYPSLNFLHKMQVLLFYKSCSAKWF